jgi:hypothetical protein
MRRISYALTLPAGPAKNPIRRTVHATSDIEERKPKRTWRIVIRRMCSVKCHAGNI